MMQKQTCVSRTTPPALTMHGDSPVISKVKPKIRIVHIFAPEIIRTDAANFRQLVQRLTGKPTVKNIDKKRKSRITTKVTEPVRSLLNETETKKIEQRERVKVKEGILGGEFLGGFSDLNGFTQEINYEFGLIPLEASHVDPLAEAQLA
ncbi:hypothetical protein NMG60_11001848 [Bertholletia excelsa]